MAPAEARPHAATAATVGVPRCLAQLFDVVIISIVAGGIQLLLSPREYAFGAGRCRSGSWWRSATPSSPRALEHEPASG